MKMTKTMAMMMERNRSDFELAVGNFIEFNTNNNTEEDDEIEVSNTLLNLPYLITKSLSSYRFPYRWASKRRRSVLKSPPAPISGKPAPEVTSPTTPLSFCPSDSDYKSKHCSKRMTSVKKTKEELLQIIEERIQTQHVLKEQLEKVKRNLDKLTAENLELKAKKQRQILVPELTQQEEAPSTSTQLPNQIPLIFNQRDLINNHYQKPQLVTFGFDLNVSAENMVAVEDLQPLDQGLVRKMMMSRAYATETKAARQSRIQINKKKKKLPRGS